MKADRFHALPPIALAALARRLARSGPADFQGHQRWLQRRGFAFSISTLQRNLQRSYPELKILRRARFLQAAAGQKLSLFEAGILIAIDELARAAHREQED